MDSGKQKELFNAAYVVAMAAQAGFNIKEMKVDDDSVDITICGKGFRGKIRNPQVELQLKCIARRELISGEVIKFPLPIKNYDDLRGNLLSPRYLVVMLVPSFDDDWIIYHDHSMALNNTCHWVSIKDHPDRENKSSVTVDVPLSQRLTACGLKHMLEKASNGGKCMRHDALFK
jgi:hypothetical protein